MITFDEAAALLRKLVAYTFAGSGIAGFSDGTLRGCTLAKPSAIAYDPAREAFFVLDQQLTTGVRVITRDLGVHTLSWQSDCSLRAPSGLAIMNNFLLIADAGNRSLRYILLNSHFTMNCRRSAAQFCSSTCGLLQTLSLDVTQPAAILPYSPSSFFILDTAQRSIRLVLLDLFIDQPSGCPLMSVQAVETLYVGILRRPSHMINIFETQHLLVADEASLILISMKTRKARRIHFSYKLLFQLTPKKGTASSSGRDSRTPCTQNIAQQACLSKIKSISGMAAHPLSNNRELILLTDSSTNMCYSLLLDLQALMKSQSFSETLETSNIDYSADIFQITSPLRKTGLRNGPLEIAEFSTPRNACSFTLDKQPCFLVCDMANSVIRLIGPNFLKQEQEQVAFVQIQSKRQDLIMGRVKGNRDKYFHALHRVLQHSIWTNTRSDSISKRRARAASAPATLPLLTGEHEGRKKMLYSYLRKSNRRKSVSNSSRSFQLERDSSTSDTPQLDEAEADPVLREITSIERSMADAVQIPAQLEKLGGRTQRRSKSNPNFTIDHRSFSDASVQYEPNYKISAVDESTQAPQQQIINSQILSKLLLSPENTIIAEDSNMLLCNSLDSETRWEFCLIEQLIHIVRGADSDGRLMQQLDALMNEDHLFNIFQAVDITATEFIVYDAASLSRFLVQLALFYSTHFNTIEDYILSYQNLSFPKRFKPSFKCLLLLRRILAKELVQLSNAVITELLVSPSVHHAIHISALEEYIAALGWTNKYKLVTAVRLFSDDQPVPLTKKQGHRLCLCTSDDLPEYAFAPCESAKTSAIRVAVKTFLFGNNFKGKRALLKITAGIDIVNVENYRLQPLSEESVVGPVFYADTTILLSSMVDLALKISCADITLTTRIPITIISNVEWSVALAVSNSCVLPTWLIELRDYTLISYK